MKQGVIITGGKMETDFASGFLQEKGFSQEEIIAADRGLLFCYSQGLVPGQIVGDFDSALTALSENGNNTETGSDAASAGKTVEDLLSWYESVKGVPVHRFPPQKDWTDTELALELALQSGWETIWILGGTGSRLDHLMANVQLLCQAMEAGADCYLADPNNLIYMRRQSFSIAAEDQWGTYISFFPFGGCVKNLSLEGFVYPLQHMDLVPSQPTLTISNELKEGNGLVTFDEGTLLVMETKD